MVNVLHSINKEQMNDLQMLDHPIFVILRDTLGSLLHCYRNNQSTFQLGKDISRLISYMTFEFVGIHVDVFKRLLIYDTLVNEFSEGINQCA